MLQGCTRVSPAAAAQARPPLRASVLTLYAWERVPPPQSAEQPDHAPQPPAQCTTASQDISLHACHCLAPCTSGQAAPPCCAGWLMA